MMRVWKAALCTALAAAGWALPDPSHAAFTVSGTVADSSIKLIPGIRVRVFDDDVGADQLLATTYTDAGGVFQAVITTADFGAELNPDIYVVIDWMFLLQPSASFGGHHIVLKSHKPANDPFDPGTFCTTPDHDPASNLNCTVLLMTDSLNPARASIANLTRLITQAVSWYENRKGTAPWSLTYDIEVHIVTDSTTSYEFLEQINIADVDINAVNVAMLGQGYQSDIYHEFAHLVHDKNHGGIVADGIANRSHNSNSEKNPIFALTEGWASYVQSRTDGLAEHANDGKVDPIDDSLFTTWRGGSPNDVDGNAESTSGSTGREGLSFENGEEVEGALSAFFYRVHVDPLFGGTDNFGVLFREFVLGKPNDIQEFVQDLVSTSGAGSQRTKRFFRYLQQHGIFWTRARLTTSPFDETAPPDDADAATEGNYKDIAGFSYLRGTVTTRLQTTPAVVLGVQNVTPASKVKIGYKRAFDDLNDSFAAFASFTPQVAFSGVDATIELDTTTFGPGKGDGDWDLVAVSENQHGFEDDMRPDWVGDPNTTVDREEKYLKVIGAWYDRDRNPATSPEKQGKVVVDNTAPVVDPASVMPK
ncbi:MAG TPA: hypothetical protein VEC57_06605 [Candidatus Limnocylindrales bacterium]|nr:hypothetical protein [Candidatus Limnocylindrales bacterium]